MPVSTGFGDLALTDCDKIGKCSLSILMPRTVRQSNIFTNKNVNRKHFFSEHEKKAMHRMVKIFGSMLSSMIYMYSDLKVVNLSLHG